MIELTDYYLISFNQIRIVTFDVTRGVGFRGGLGWGTGRMRRWSSNEKTEIIDGKENKSLLPYFTNHKNSKFWRTEEKFFPSK